MHQIDVNELCHASICMMSCTAGGHYNVHLPPRDAIVPILKVTPLEIFVYSLLHGTIAAFVGNLYRPTTTIAAYA